MRVQISCAFFLFCFALSVVGFSQDSTLAHVFFQKGNMLEEKKSYDSAAYFYQQSQQAFQALANRYEDSTFSLREIQLERFRLNLFVQQKRFFEAEQGFMDLLSRIEDRRLDRHIEAGICYYYIGISRYKLKKIQEAKEAFLLAKAILEKGLSYTHYYLGDCFIQLGLIAKRERDFSTALTYYRPLLQIPEGFSDDADHVLIKAYGNMGLTYNSLTDLDSAVLSLEKVLEILANKEDQRSLENRGKTLANLGILLKNSGRFRDAIHYYQRAEKIYEQLDDTSLIYSIFDNLGEGYRYIGEYEKSITYLHEAIAFESRRKGPNDAGLIRLYTGLAETYLIMENVQQALDYYQLGLSIFDQHYDRSSYKHSSIFFGLGDCYLFNKDFEKAEYWYTVLLNNAIKERGENSISVAFSYSYLAKLFFQMKDYQQSLEFRSKALHIQLLYLDKMDYDVGVSYHYLGADYTYLQQCEKADSCFTIAEKVFASTDLDLQSDRIHNAFNRAVSMMKCGKDDIEVYDYFQSAIPLITELSYSYVENSSKLSLQKSFHNDFLLIAKLANRLHEAYPDSGYERKVFFYSEHIKAITLLQQMTAAEANMNSRIPADLRAKEAELKERRTVLERRLYLVNNQSAQQDTTRILTLQNQLFRNQRSYDSLIRIFEQKYPLYHQLKYDIQIASVPELQEHLDADQALLEYMILDSSILAMLIQPDSFFIKVLPKDSLLHEKLDRYREVLSSCPPGFSGGCDFEERNKERSDLSHYLFKQLFLPLKEYLPRRLVIVPDGELGFIPFETLSKEPGTTTKSYLLNDYDMSYAFSASIWLNMKQKPQSSLFTPSVLAFAPEFAHNQSQQSSELSDSRQRGQMFGPLSSHQEVLEIQRLIGGDIWANTDATTEKLTELSRDYKVIHLATHGKMSQNPQFSFLAFYDANDSILSPGGVQKYAKALYVADLYNLQLNTDLVVLSACETGVGKLLKGEGIASLAQGFTYAGAKSLVSTLWSVNDATTTTFMTSFYSYLADGWTKDKALQQAKKDLIAEGYHHPFYWAGYVLMGDSDEIEFSPVNWTWMMGIASLLLLVLLVWGMRRAKVEKSFS